MEREQHAGRFLNKNFQIKCTRFGTRVDYIFCNESLRKDWMPVTVEHYNKEDFGDHSAVIATLIKKSGK